MKVSKTITLRIDDDTYNKFNEYAKQERRSISNLIETLALNKLEENNFMDDFEMEEIINNQELMKKLNQGHKAVMQKEGKFVD